MRILTGDFKGRALPFEPKPGLRPTADKVRKAIFDTFQGVLQGKRVLDLFSGTGAMGLEALSNGAASSDFVEKDPSQAKQIERTLEKWGLSSLGQVAAIDVLRAIDRFAFRGERFDVIFIDPPYEEKRGQEVVEALSEKQLLSPKGFIVLECAKREDLPERVGNYTRIRERRYGQSKVMIFSERG